MSARKAEQESLCSLAAVAAIVARLRGPDGCPWDREQTFESIRKHTLEEIYEVFDAIERRAWPELRDELGDLLLQVLLYARIAEDEGHFGIAEVAAGLQAKLIRRHPHVFGDEAAADSEAVKRHWEAIKREEKSSRGSRTGWLEDIPRAMPATLEATKLGSRAAKAGFDWPDVEGLFAKLDEEAAELRAELGGAADRLEDEMGDLLFTAVNLARHLRVDPEMALRGANLKFRRRFEAMEQVAGGADALALLTAEELDALWRQVKQEG